MSNPRNDPTRRIRAPRGNTLSCKSWLSEAAYRMLQNNLDAEVAEDPTSLVVYGGIGRAARDWACYDKILETLRTLEDNETLLVQSGKPVGVFPSHADAPRGMGFLYSLNRLNVATSRARCVCVLVASPDLFEPECRTPRQIQLANAFCRYREIAEPIAVAQ